MCLWVDVHIQADGSVGAGHVGAEDIIAVWRCICRRVGDRGCVAEIGERKVCVVCFEELWRGRVEGVRGGSGNVAVCEVEGRVGDGDGGRGLERRGVCGVGGRCGGRGGG